MRSFLVAMAIPIIAGIVGVYIGESENRQRTEYKFVTAYDEHKGRQPVTNGTSLACKSLSDALVSESQIGERNVTARAAPGTDDVALKISDDGRSQSLLTAADIRAGVTAAGQPLAIIDKTPNYIVASRYIWPDYIVVMINIDTGNAVSCAI
jgi:hypothetical protein